MNPTILGLKDSGFLNQVPDSCIMGIVEPISPQTPAPCTQRPENLLRSGAWKFAKHSQPVPCGIPPPPQKKKHLYQASLVWWLYTNSLKGLLLLGLQASFERGMLGQPPLYNIVRELMVSLHKQQCIAAQSNTPRQGMGKCDTYVTCNRILQQHS